MRGTIAKIINKACRNEKPAIVRELKRTWNKLPKPERSKFRADLVEAINQQQETTDAK